MSRAHLVPVLLDDPEHRLHDPSVQLGEQRLVLQRAVGQRDEPSLQRAGRLVAIRLGLPVEHPLHLVPERRAEPPAGGMVEELLLDRVGARDHVGRLLEPHDPVGEQLVELPPHRMTGIGGHLEQGALDAGDHLGVHLLVHESRAPTRGSPPGSGARMNSSLSTMRPASPLITRSSSCWWRSFGGEQQEALGEHRRDRALPQRLDHAPLEQGVHVLVPHHVGRAPQRGGRVPGERASRSRVAGATPPTRRLGCMREELRAQHLGGEEVVLDEVAEGAADPVLASAG